MGENRALTATVRTRRSHRAAWLAAAVTALAVVHLETGPAGAVSFCNTIPIVSSGSAQSSPYPSPIVVSGLTGTVTDVNVTLLDFVTHGDPNPEPHRYWAEDTDVLLVAPNNANVILMSDAGGDNDSSSGPVNEADITLDDEAATVLPADSLITTGTFRPVDDDTDANPNPADSWPFTPPLNDTTLLSTFDGSDPNGTWNLYVYDDQFLAANDFVGGWCVDITVAEEPGPRAPADFDGDGDTDVSVFRPSDGQWFVQGGPTVAWGTSGDIPVPGDYDGDADADVAVFRPSTGQWFVQGGPTVAWGTAGDIPVPGDYDGDGDTDVAVFRPSTGLWFVQGGPTVAWGTAGDIPVPGDYDGDGDTDVAVFRPSTGLWFVQGGPTTAWGTSGDIPVPGDYDGDGNDDLAVFRPTTGVWFVQGGPTVAWGTSGDVPVPGDYDGDADTDVAVFRPGTGTWFVQGGPATAWGAAGDVALPLPDAIRRFYFPPL